MQQLTRICLKCLYLFRMEANGFIKPYAYLRDAIWPNLRTRTLTKMDKSRRTGEEPQEFDSLDELVQEILGKESPTVVGLNVVESLTVPQISVQSEVLKLARHNIVDFSLDGAPFLSFLNENRAPVELPSNLNYNSTTPCSKKRRMNSVGEFEKLKVIKEKLIIRKLELQILKLENDLNVDHINTNDL